MGVWTGSVWLGYGTMLTSCEYNKPVGSVRNGELHDWWSNC
jgi:hypothetical protein